MKFLAIAGALACLGAHAAASRDGPPTTDADDDALAPPEQPLEPPVVVLERMPEMMPAWWRANRLNRETLLTLGAIASVAFLIVFSSTVYAHRRKEQKLELPKELKDLSPKLAKRSKSLKDLSEKSKSLKDLSEKTLKDLEKKLKDEKKKKKKKGLKDLERAKSLKDLERAKSLKDLSEKRRAKSKKRAKSLKDLEELSKSLRELNLNLSKLRKQKKKKEKKPEKKKLDVVSMLKEKMDKEDKEKAKPVEVEEVEERLVQRPRDKKDKDESESESESEESEESEEEEEEDELDNEMEELEADLHAVDVAILDPTGATGAVHHRLELNSRLLKLLRERGRDAADATGRRQVAQKERAYKRTRKLLEKLKEEEAKKRRELDALEEAALARIKSLRKSADLKLEEIDGSLGGIQSARSPNEVEFNTKRLRLYDGDLKDLEDQVEMMLGRVKHLKLLREYYNIFKKQEEENPDLQKALEKLKSLKDDVEATLDELGRVRSRLPSTRERT